MQTSYDGLPTHVEDALIQSLLQDVEHLIDQHGLADLLVGLALYCSLQAKAKRTKPDPTSADEASGYCFRDAAKAIEVAASLIYRTQKQQDP